MVTEYQAKTLPQQSRVLLTYDLLRDFGRDGCPVVTDSKKIYERIEEISGWRHEITIVGSVDADCRLLNCTAIIRQGTSPIHMGDVFQYAIMVQAKAVFLARNLKSDSLLRREVARAGLAIGIPLLEDIVVTSRGHYLGLTPQSLSETDPCVRARIKHCRQTNDRIAGWHCHGCGATNIRPLNLSLNYHFDESHCFSASCYRCDRFCWLTAQSGKGSGRHQSVRRHFCGRTAPIRRKYSSGILRGSL